MPIRLFDRCELASFFRIEDSRVRGHRPINLPREVTDAFVVSDFAVTLDRRRQGPASSRRRTLVVAGVVLLCLAAAAGGVMLFQSHRSPGATETGASSILRPPPSARTIVCRTGPTPGCAATAGTRMGLPTAWLPAPSGYRLRWLAAYAPASLSLRQRTAFEELMSGRLVVDVSTQPLRPAKGVALGRFVVDGATVQALTHTDAQGATLIFAWTRRGHAYSLSIYGYHRADHPRLVPADYIGLVRQVRYAEPSA